MVAATVGCSDRVYHVFHCNRLFYRTRTIYLLPVLKMQIKNHKVKDTILVMTVGFIAMHLLSGKTYFLYIGLGIGAIGILSNRVSAFVHAIWEKLGYLLGEVNNRILLTITFFL